MNKFNYEKIAKKVDGIIEKFGISIPMSRAVVSSFNLSTGEVVAGNAIAEQYKGIVLSKSDSSLSNYDIDFGPDFTEQNGKILLMSTYGVIEPKLHDSYIFNGMTYVCFGWKKVAPANSPVIYIVGVVAQ